MSIGWKLVNTETKQIYFINEKTSTLHAGRDPAKEIVSKSKLVSRNHAIFKLKSNGDLQVSDNQSSNGIFVNGTRIPSTDPFVLQNGDIVALGFNPESNYKNHYSPPYCLFKILMNNESDSEFVIDIESDEDSSIVSKNSIENSSHLNKLHENSVIVIPSVSSKIEKCSKKNHSTDPSETKQLDLITVNSFLNSLKTTEQSIESSVKRTAKTVKEPDIKNDFVNVGGSTNVSAEKNKGSENNPSSGVEKIFSTKTRIINKNIEQEVNTKSFSVKKLNENSCKIKYERIQDEKCKKGVEKPSFFQSKTEVVTEKINPSFSTNKNENKDLTVELNDEKKTSINQTANTFSNFSKLDSKSKMTRSCKILTVNVERLSKNKVEEILVKKQSSSSENKKDLSEVNFDLKRKCETVDRPNKKIKKTIHDQFFNTQELISTLVDDKDIKKHNKTSLINKNDDSNIEKKNRFSGVKIENKNLNPKKETSPKTENENSKRENDIFVKNKDEVLKNRTSLKNTKENSINVGPLTENKTTVLKKASKNEDDENNRSENNKTKTSFGNGNEKINSKTKTTFEVENEIINSKTNAFFGGGNERINSKTKTTFEVETEKNKKDYQNFEDNSLTKNHQESISGSSKFENHVFLKPNQIDAKTESTSRSTQLISSKEAKVKPEPIGFSNEDVIVVEEDDDDDNFFVPCSQLLQSSQDQGCFSEENATNNDNDSLFLSIKKELEELDKTDFIPYIPIDSDSSDWYNEYEGTVSPPKATTPSTSTNLQATTVSEVVPGVYDNFEGVDENNVVDIVYFNPDVPPSNDLHSDLDDALSENEGNLIIEEELESKEESKKGEEVNKDCSKDKKPIKFSTSSFYPQLKKVPIVEPHKETRKRSKKSGENHQERKRKKKRNDKSPSGKKRNASADSNRKQMVNLNFIDIKEAERIKNERREKVKEIARQVSHGVKTVPNMKKGAVKVKVSDGRGQFLLGNNKVPLERNKQPIKTSKKPSVANGISVPSKHCKECSGKTPKPTVTPSSLSGEKKLTNSVTVNVPKRPLVTNNSKCNLPNAKPVYLPNKLLPAQNNMGLDVSDIVNQVIQWSASWLDQQKNNSTAPPVNRHNPMEMCLKFLTYNDYYNNVVPLLLLELWSSLYKDWINSGNDSRKELFCSRIEEEKIVDNFTVIKGLTYVDKKRNAKGCYVRDEDLVVFEFKGKANGKTVVNTGFGYVSGFSKKSTQKDDIIDTKVAEILGLVPDYCISFVLKTKSFVGTADKASSLMFIRVISSMGSYLRLFKSVKYLQMSPLKNFILNPKAEDFKVEGPVSCKLRTNVRLNKNQFKAVGQATQLCLGEKPGILLIQGPPGTGKSTVITQIIQEIIYSNDDPAKCVLLVAPSNGAIDELVERLISIREKLDDINRKKLKLIRIGPPNSIHQKVSAFTLEYMADLNFWKDVDKIFPQHSNELLIKQKNILRLKNDLKNEYKNDKTLLSELEFAKKDCENYCSHVLGRQYFTQMDHIKWNLIYNANVICTTLSSCFSLQRTVFRNSKKITCCIVDEATQANEQETLIPLTLGLDKLVLVGDPRQLSPTTLSQEAKKLKYGMSLFSRLSKNFEIKVDNPIVMLDIQYRMHQEISAFPTKTYYNNRLQNGTLNRANKFKRLVPYMVFNLAMYFPTHQYQNDHEVEFILKLVNSILSVTVEENSMDIGIITPYNNQKDQLNQRLKVQSFRNGVQIAANTVDSFQGQEKDIIIVSFVRMDGNNFVSDEQRLNVALTRAKYALYIVGSKYLFDTCAVVRKIRDDAQNRNVLHVVSDTYSTNLSQTITRDI